MTGHFSPAPRATTAIAPGKIILSGEHAVVYGRPALVTAVRRHATVVADPTDIRGLTLSSPDLSATMDWSWAELRKRADLLTQRYEEFLAGERDIGAVADGPGDLAGFLVDLVTRRFFLKPRSGLTLLLRSDIPVGCGMGSSAALAGALLRALAAHFAIELEPDRLYEYALEAEKLQHGRPSGVDPYVSIHGGCLRFRAGRAEARLPLPALPWHLVHTGTPESTTGQCVMQVARDFEGSAIWNEFEEVTAEMEKALTRAEWSRVMELIRRNHALLVRIGVVSARVQSFVARVEAQGGAAKICGAGSVAGEAGGVALVCMSESPRALCEEFGYPMMKLEGEPEGARILE